MIVPIVKKEADTEEVMLAVEGLHAAAKQAGIRCKVDASTERTPGWKFNHYEMKVCTGPLVCRDTLCSQRQDRVNSEGNTAKVCSVVSHSSFTLCQQRLMHKSARCLLC